MTGRHGEALAADPVIAAAIAAHSAEAERLMAAHRQTRAPWFRFPRLARKAAAPAPVSPRLEVLAAADMDVSDTGTFTGILAAHQGPAIPPEAFTRPADAPPREDEAARRIMAERADLARMYAPASIPAAPWGEWDGPANREPMRQYVPDLNADLTDLPAFREALARRTRCSVSQCLCGEPVAGQTWAERMVRAGIHLYSMPESAPPAFAAAADRSAA